MTVSILLAAAQCLCIVMLYLNGRAARREARRLQSLVNATPPVRVTVTGCFMKGRPGKPIISGDSNSTLTLDRMLIVPLEDVSPETLTALGFEVKSP